MKVIGIICEYNPFHNGHKRQFDLIRERFGQDAAIVCLMSGDFCQRGICAVYPKSVRAAAAVDCGADLVLEMPVTVSLRSAEGFAAGSVEIFDRLGVIDGLCFGCESENAAMLRKTADILCTADYQNAFHAEIGRGISYAAARQAALISLGADGSVLEKPNDILAVEYLKALSVTNSKIEPFAVQRGGDYNSQSPDAENPSALSLRAILPDGDIRPFVPQAAAEHYQNADCYSMRAGEKAMLARLYGMKKEQWQSVPFSSEGLWSCVYKAVQSENSIEAIIERAKSKRYVRTRLARLLTCAFLGITEADMRREAPYIRALAFSGRGAGLLKKIRENGQIPVYHAGEKTDNSDYSELENRTDRLYSLFLEQNRTQDTVLAEKNKVYYKKM